MAVQKDTIKNILHISVTGFTDSDKERAELLKLLCNPGKGLDSVQITFFDAKMLPAEIIEILAGFCDINPPMTLKIFILHRYLCSYLIGLGIANTCIPRKSLKKSGNIDIRAIAIGGSAESMEKIFTIVENLPVCDISIFIIQHVLEDSPNLLEKLIKSRTEYSVSTPRKGAVIKNKTIYIAPSGYQMEAVEKKIILSKDPPVNYARPSIEVLFRSLSAEYREGLLAIILSGYGSDGCKALGYLKENESTIIVEDPEECVAKDLPLNCIETKNPDYVLKMPQIVSFLSDNLEKFSLNDDEVRQLLSSIFNIYRYDFQNYSIDSIKRRIRLFMIKENLSTLGGLRDEVLSDADHFEDFLLDLTVNVTDFFRNPEVFRILKDKVFPYLNSYSRIKIWSAGCSTGMEAYSLAILLDESGILDKTQIYATDMNPYVIEEAKNGLYSKQNFDLFKSNYILSGGSNQFEKYFEIKTGYLKIKDYLKHNILFFQHSIVNSGILNEFQLIICRNVLIYFDNELQKKVLNLFQESLDICGFLVLGDKEDITINKGTEYFSVYDKNAKIYKKIKK